MENTIFTKDDFTQMKSKGIPPDRVCSQIESFKKGFPFSHLIKACTIDEGIIKLREDDLPRLSKIYSEACESGRSMKFVPASGAASRMFKALLWVYENYSHIEKNIDDKISGERPEYEAFSRFIAGLKKFAFYDELKSVMSRDGLDPEELISKVKYKEILKYTLTPIGINLAGLPKGLIPFHKYKDHSRTPIEEHLIEALNYTKDLEGTVRIHVTISPEHESLFKDRLGSFLENLTGLRNKIRISFSSQSTSTDTIAVDLHNRPFRDEKGRLFFRPGGHGALLDNLNNLQGDILFIKNIDNIVPDHLKQETYRYKRVLGGYLISIQEQIFRFLESLDRENYQGNDLNELFEFIENILFITTPESVRNGTNEKKKEFLYSRLNRPLRICGMVRNVGEPGGGPFWVRNREGLISPQIVESSQVDMRSPGQKRIWESSTHFNPVDLVCGVRDYKGHSFDLKKFVDNETGLISTKSKDGRELKALELPGLWNGSMAYWNSVFVEVPIITFNPVKTVLDLLRKEHQPEWD